MNDGRRSFARELSTFFRYIARFTFRAPGFLFRPLDRVFEQIHHHNLWGDDESRSGVGSTLYYTEQLRRELPELLHELSARTLLDIPCGDFHWMKEVALDGIEYIGADIVADLVDELSARYADNGRRFMTLDITRDDLPEVDVVLCRHCLVHLSNKDAARALDNIKRSGSRYLLATTFPSVRYNKRIASGLWRPVNLELAPFHLPPPIRLLADYREFYGGFFTGRQRDISLGLWDLSRLG